MKEFGWRKRVSITQGLARQGLQSAQVEDLGATMFGGGGYGAWPVWLNVYTVTVSSTLLALDLMCNSIWRSSALWSYRPWI